MLLACKGRECYQDFLIDSLCALDRQATVKVLAARSTWAPHQIVMATRLLGELDQPQGAQLLERFATHPLDRVRTAALEALAKTAPDRPVLRRALETRDEARVKVAQALRTSPHPRAARVLAAAIRIDPLLRKLCEGADKSGGPRFRAVFRRKRR